VAVRGWLEYPEGRAEEVLGSLKETLEAASLDPRDARRLQEAWIVPELHLSGRAEAPLWCYLFIGVDLPAAALPVVRRQVESLARLHGQDGVVTRWTTGVLHLEDDAGGWARVWRLERGSVGERSSTPFD